MEDIINVIISNGIFATLFVGLLFYQLKDSAAREKKYIETIDKLANHLEIVEELKDDVTDIKNELFKNKKDKNETKTKDV